MDKAEMIAMLMLAKSDLSHLKTISDYIQQFDETVSQVRNVMESAETSKP